MNCSKGRLEFGAYVVPNLEEWEAEKTFPAKDEDASSGKTNGFSEEQMGDKV